MLLLVLGAAAMQGSCGSDDPTRVGRPPIVQSFSPGDQSFTAFVGDVVEFRLEALDPDNDPIVTEFSVNGALRKTGESFAYAIEDTGDVTVRATVRDDQHVSFIEWIVAREPQVDFAPQITSAAPVEANPRVVVGNDIGFVVQAVDPEGAELSYRYTVDDVLVAEEHQFEFHATSMGTHTVRVTVSDGANVATRSWQLKVTDIPDTILPGPVDIVTLEPGMNPGEIDIAWTAVGKDGMTGTASLYHVRTLPSPIITESDWARGSERPNVPAPLEAGQTMSMTLGSLQPARLTYVAVRAEDDFGNLSPILDTPSVVTRGVRVSGVVIDALTNLRIPNVSIRFALQSTVSDANGEWVLTELGLGADYLRARDETGPDVGAYYDYALPYNVSHNDHVELYLLPARPLETTHYADFLEWFRVMTDTEGNPFGAQSRRWDLPIALYVRAYSKGGLDYRETIEQVANEFNSLLGETVFTVVTTGLGDGVETVYIDNLPQDSYGVSEWTNDWYPRRGRIQFRTGYTLPTRDVLEVVTRHELGHVLGLNHSTDLAHVMVGGQAPQAEFFAPDEVALLLCRYHLPRGWDCRLFERE